VKKELPMTKALIILLVGVSLLWLPTLTPALGEEVSDAEPSNSEQDVDPTEKVLVKIGDIEITQYEFEVEFRAAMNRMKPETRAMFENPHGRRQFLKMLADEKVWVNGAIEVGLDKDPQVITETKMYRDKTLVRHFYEKELIMRAMPSDSEVRSFYDANPGKFLTPVRIGARHILLEDSLEAEAVLRQLKMGADFAEMAKEKSVDEKTAGKGGDLGLLVEGVALPYSVGGTRAFADSLFAQEPGVLSRVLKSGHGYHIVLLYEKMPSEVKPFESVKKNISDGFLKERVTKLKNEMFEELNRNYPIEYLIPDSSVSPERGAVPPDVASSPEELFQAAMDSKDSHQRIRIYEELIKKFPDSKYASQAQFMIGFIYSEELGEYDKAEEAFRIVIAEYPESELLDSAKWMIENMRDESQSVGSVEDVKRRAKESSQPSGK
jgi:peptidyl-prolyl cis-trans isomerase C